MRQIRNVWMLWSGLAIVVLAPISAGAYTIECGQPAVDVGPTNEVSGDYCGTFATATELPVGIETIKGVVHATIIVDIFEPPLPADLDFFVIPDAAPNVGFSFDIIVSDSTGVTVRVWDENEQLILQAFSNNEGAFDTFLGTTPATGALYFEISTAQDSAVGYTINLDVARVPEPSTVVLASLGLAGLALRRRYST